MEQWQKEIQTAIRDPQELQDFLHPLHPLQRTSDKNIPYPLLLPRSFAQLIKEQGPNSPLWRQFIPQDEEIDEEWQSEGLQDPIGDHEYGHRGQLIHRYSNRLLFNPTPLCPVACRYCFRKNELTPPRSPLFEGDLPSTLHYLDQHPEVEEIIFSGGDPLILSDDKLAFYLDQFGQFPSIKYIRLHTRTPVVLPSRITANFTELFHRYRRKAFKKIHLVLHINHLSELSPQVEAAITRLQQQNSPLELLAQSVLLRGVNDDSSTLAALFTHLSDLGVRPYYLHHPDRVKGGMHFYLSLEEGRKIYGQLRNLLPGWAIPHYMIDVPGGEGKIWAFNSESFAYSGQLLNRFGQVRPIEEVKRSES